LRQAKVNVPSEVKTGAFYLEDVAAGCRDFSDQWLKTANNESAKRSKQKLKQSRATSSYCAARDTRNCFVYREATGNCTVETTLSTRNSGARDYDDKVRLHIERPI